VRARKHPGVRDAKTPGSRVYTRATRGTIQTDTAATNARTVDDCDSRRVTARRARRRTANAR
jgi:hypothetical protein